MDDMNLFVPITKIDARKRLVYGVVTAEAPDVAGEVCDYASTKPLYQKWSDAFASATAGKSFGNLRAMHGNVAAGKLVDIAFNDAAKRIEICGKVVDDAEWQKVEEGVYTGFSQGGRYLKRWPDPNAPELIRYTAEPLEISLVDHPCLPEATFTVVKADGSTELRKFKTGLDVGPGALDKIGARHSKADKARIKLTHDLLVALDPDCCAAASSGRSYLCNGDAGDREQPTDNQLWGHTVAKEQRARNHGEHRKQQAEWCDAAHGATGDQPEPKTKPNNSSDENRVGECQPTTFIRRDKARQLSTFKEQRHQHDLRHREQRHPPH